MNTLKSQQIREVFTYARNFKKNLFVLYFDDLILQSYHLHRIIKDILYLLDIVNIRIVIVTGAKSAINTVLHKYHKKSKFMQNMRIIPDEDIELVQMASFDTATKMLNAFSKYRKTAIIGNWITARGLGVIEGVDYHNAGKVDSLNKQSIMQLLDDGIIPIFPTIGWSRVGKPYSLEALSLATEIGVLLHANKLFYLIDCSPEVKMQDLDIPVEKYLDKNESGTILRMSQETAEHILKKNADKNTTQSFHILSQSVYALQNNLDRVHLINGLEDGSLLEELFSSAGTGIMIHNDEYQAIESLKEEEVEEAWELTQPLVESGILAERSIDMLRAIYRDYVCYKVDREIYGIAALHMLNEENAEIAGVAVKDNKDKSGVGRKLIEYLITVARKRKYKNVFVLTTASGDWFESLGFVQTNIDAMPEIRKVKYLKQKRGSRIYCYSL